MPSINLVEARVDKATSLDAVPVEHRTAYVAAIVWTLFDRFQNAEVITINKWFVHYTVRVAQLRPLLEQWFGPHPVTT